MNNQTKRIEWVDVAKGIGILLVVHGHSRGPGFLLPNFFHMPMFFLISGLLYKSDGSLKEYIVKKRNSLYIPYIFWNLLGAVIWGIAQGTSIRGLCKQGIKILLTLSRGQFFGATWFLGALFLVSVFYKILDVFFENCKHKRLYRNMICLVLVLIGFSWTLPFMLSRTLILCGFYAMGVWIKEQKWNLDISHEHLKSIAALGVFLLIALNHTASMGNNEYSSKGLFVIAALCGSYVVFYLSQIIQKYTGTLKTILVYFGKNSIDILIWHFVVFNVVIVLQLYLDGKPLSTFVQYSPVYTGNNGWWLAYLSVGMLLSLVLGKLLRKSNVLKKLHIV